MSDLPILYSFRRCPYAIRARMTLVYSGIQCELREVDLKNKPKDLLNASSKATVPVLILPDGRILEESLDIMRWALSQNDPEGLIDWDAPRLEAMTYWIQQNDNEFKENLDKYKYYLGNDPKEKLLRKQACEKILMRMNGILKDSKYMFANEKSWADLAIFPFVRQFSTVDRDEFTKLEAPFLKNWLQEFLNSDLFLKVMKKYNVWEKAQKEEFLI